MVYSGTQPQSHNVGPTQMAIATLWLTRATAVTNPEALSGKGRPTGRGADVSQAGTRLASQTLTIIFDKYMLLIPVSQIRHLLPRMVVGWL